MTTSYLPKQTKLELETLYEVSKWNAMNQNKINFWINSGTVDIYNSNSATQPTALSEMTLDTNDTNVGGLVEINVLPRYIAISQNSGTATEIVATGLIVKKLPSIS